MSQPHAPPAHPSSIQQSRLSRADMGDGRLPPKSSLLPLYDLCLLLDFSARGDFLQLHRCNICLKDTTCVDALPWKTCSFYATRIEIHQIVLLSSSANNFGPQSLIFRLQPNTWHLSFVSSCTPSQLCATHLHRGVHIHLSCISSIT
jgi:hypothetical protein